MTYEIELADNGYLVSWWDEDIKRYKVFEVSDDIDLLKEDPQALIDLLYFVKEEIAGQCYSKHKTKNVVVGFQGED